MQTATEHITKGEQRELNTKLLHEKIWNIYIENKGNILAKEIAEMCGCTYSTVSKAITKYFTRKNQNQK